MNYKQRICKLFKFKIVKDFIHVEVNKFGEIRDSKTKIDRNEYIKNGYVNVHLKTTTGKWKYKGLHVIVAITFVKGFRSGLQVNHDDLDKQNNYYRNLEWMTSSENAKHAIRNGIPWGNKKGEENTSAKLKENEVIAIRWLYSTGLFKQLDLVKEFKVAIDTIGFIINYRTWKNI